MKPKFTSLIRCSLVMCLFSCNRPVMAAQSITAIWANNGEDKVTRDELRASHGTKVTNSIWDGSKISIFGGRNEVVAFNVILEAGSRGASNLSVSFNRLNGPSGSAITSASTTGNGVFNWTGRQIELFYVRYLQIKGLSMMGYDKYDERHVPQRMRRNWAGDGIGSGSWQDRPDHDKFYPDIAVPLELVPTFNIAPDQNQSIWVDVYIPKTAPSGNYLGRIVVQEGGTVVGSIPVQLKVYNFTLPDVSSAKTMLYYSPDNINHRYLGATYVNPNSAGGSKPALLRDRHYQLAHRHRLSLIGDSSGNCGVSPDQPCPESVPRLDGSLFTAANGYDGPGVNTSNGIYSIGTYGVWSWKTGTEADMRQHTDAWATWFSQNAPGVDYFLYLIDESADYAQIETWAKWILNNPGPGREVRSMATVALPTAVSQCPSLDIPTSGKSIGVTSVWQPLADQYAADPRKRFYMYAGGRPGAGSTTVEDDGVALREKAWGQYKKRVQRWFAWETTYYNNFQGGTGETNVFQSAFTFGGNNLADPVLGQTGWNYTNGDGVLFYPGTDVLHPADSYGVEGPFASLRLKFWRRGIQDVDYLTMAANANPATVQAIVNRTVPKVLWEYGVNSATDPTYIRTDMSWSNNPDVWEAARLQLANIIATSPGNTGSLPTPTLDLPESLPVNAQISAGYPSGYSIASFEWSIIPKAPVTGFLARGLNAVARAELSARASTPSATAKLADMNLAPGYYQISVMAIDSGNNASPSAQANVTLVPVGLSAIQVYPNPWRADKAYPRRMTFDLIPYNATVQLFTVSGHLVKTVLTSGTSATWDLTNDSGDLVGSGLYIYTVTTPDGQKTRGKVAIIK